MVSLGCSRNLVDSEVITGSLRSAGLKAGRIEDGVDVCVVNTCAFIESARTESVDAIMEIASLKKRGQVKKLIVCGCLPQLYKGKLFKMLPEADMVVGTSDFPKIGSLLRGLSKSRRYKISSRPEYLYDDLSPRSILTPRHYAYVKISEGCSNLCSYCIIPRLRGRLRSRAIGSVVNEVQSLARSGRLKEINLVGQDTTVFGKDLYGRMALPELLRGLCGLDNSVEWIRVLYTHPAHYTDAFIETVASEYKICKYLDLPVQHISDRILKAMNRRVTRKEMISLIRKLRKRIPGLMLRTSIIVGFPRETDREFSELLDFLRETRFERLGAFMYCKETGTAAGRIKDQVAEPVKRDRFDELMRVQQKIAEAANSSYIGKTVKVLIGEKEPGGTSFLGRTEGDAPEVDGEVFVSGRGVRTGEFCDVKITGSTEYDLAGIKI